MSDNLLVLLTSTYPYGSGEAFLLDELEYVGEYDMDVLVVAKRRESQYYAVPSSIMVDGVFFESQRIRKLKSILWIPSVLIHFKDTIRNLFDAKGLFGKIKYVLFEADKYRYTRALIRLLRKYDVSAYKKIVFYSYWFTNTVDAAIRIKEKEFRENTVSIITRIHGYDLYESKSVLGFFPDREKQILNLDRIYPISVYGNRYLQKRYINITEKIETAYLGTKDRGVSPIKSQEEIHLVSCSNIIPVKRVDEIAKAVLLLSEKLSAKRLPIRWTHFGGGIGFHELYRHFSENHKEGLSVEFKGQRPKEEIMEYYRTTEIDLFLNMSTSEGIPVSIMEAMSFGLPVIATDVGGTSEIVIDGYNGRLLSAAATANDLSMAIINFFEQSNEEVQTFRKNARLYWDENFNAEKNYRYFYSQILSLFCTES